MRTVVVGLGNEMASDDGLGVAAIRLLRERELPAHVELIEGGTVGIDLIDLIANADRAVLVDAAISGCEPGTIHRFRFEDLPAEPIFTLSLHGFGPVEAIRLGQMVRPEEMPAEIVLYGLEAAETQPFRIGLSEMVGKALPGLVERIVEEVRR